MQGWEISRNSSFLEANDGQELTVFFDRLQTAYGTVSCVWDDSLNGDRSHFSEKTVFIAANFRDNEEVLPHLIIQIWHTVALLPEGQAFISIYESGSTDNTSKSSAI